MTFGDQHAQRVQPEQLSGHLGRGQRRPPDPDVQATACQLPELLWHPRLDLVEIQLRVLVHRPKDLCIESWLACTTPPRKPGPELAARWAAWAARST